MLKITPKFTSAAITTSNNQDNKQYQGQAYESSVKTGTLPVVSKDFAVKTPIKYYKICDIPLPFDNKACLYKLANGQRVVIVPREGKTVIKTYVNTGSMNEPDNIRGISHYIEHNLFNGSQGLEAGEFFKQVDKMGASTNASTGFSETNYFISSHLLNNDDLEKQIKIHASMLETPKFSIDMLEKEKGIVNSEINMITSDPQNIGINKALKNLYQIDTKSLDMIGGTTANITNLTREDVAEYFDRNYYPANMVTVITGEVDPENTMKLISKYFSSNKRPPSERHFENLKPINKPVREDIISDKATASTVILAFDGPKNNNMKDKILASSLAQILTASKASRINQGLNILNSYAITEIERISPGSEDGRAILIMAEGTENNSEKIIKTIYTEIAKLITNPPSEDELNAVKKRMLQIFSNIFEYSSFTNDFIGTAFLDNDIKMLTNYKSIINSITPDDITNAAKKFLDLNKVSLTVVHPATATEESIKNNYKNTGKISFSGSSAKKQAINMNNVKEYRLNNNFAVVLNDTQNNNAYFNILYKNTRPPQNIKPATARLLFKLLNSGTMNKTVHEYQKELDKFSINMYMESGRTDLLIKSRCFADDIQTSLKLAKEVLKTPRFRQDTLDKMKSELKDEILTSEKSAEDKLLPELYKGYQGGCSKEEILNSIDSVTLDDLKNLYDYIISNGQANIVVSAPFSKKPELKQIVFSEIGELPKVAPKNFEIKKSYKKNEETKVLTDTFTKPQAQIIKAYKFQVNQNIKDEITLELLNTILGGNPSSRLFQDLREQQKLAYSVHSDVTAIDDIGTIQLKIGTTTENKDTGEISFDNLKKSIEGFNKHIQKLKTGKVTDEELNNAKLSLKNTILNINESNKGKNFSLADGLISPYGLNSENLIFETIDKITPDDIYNAANYIFKDKPVYSILATENTLDANKEFLKSLKD